MTWKGDPRTTTAEHRALRLEVLKRDRGICHVCHEPGADELDHIIPVVECERRGLDPNVLTNLAAIHDVPCHRRKSAAEGHAEQTRRRELRRRPADRHPGLRN